MEIENSPLWNEVEQVIAQSSLPVHYSYTAQLHANNINYAVLRVLEVMVTRDYQSHYTDTITVRCLVQQGQYYASIYPYMDALEMTLFKNPIQEVSDQVNNTATLETERYICHMSNDKGSPFMQQNGANAVSSQALDLSNILEVEFELVSKAIAQMRMSQAGQIFRGARTDTAIRALLTQASQSIQVDGARAIQGVSMVAGHNTTTREHVVIPQGIGLLDAPQYIHEMCGGVYTSGFGYYLQNSYWHVYPCYDPTRFSQGKATLTIINVPSNKMPNIERTYRQSGNNTVILATGDTRFSDRTNARQLNQGNGTRFTDASKFIDSIVTVKNNKALMARAVLNTEVVNVKRADGYNNVRRSDNPINANPYVEYSNLAERSGSVFALTWHNSNPSLITPGQCVQILYLNGETVVTVLGVILKAFHHIRVSSSGADASRHITDSGLSVFVNRPVGNGDATGNVSIAA